MNRVVGIALAGVVSGAAYLAAQAIDIKVTGHDTDDRVLVGAIAPVDRADAVSAGAALHLVNAVVFSAAFRLVGRDLLAGPMWLRGLLSALIETIALYLLSMFEHHHPAIREIDGIKYMNSGDWVETLSALVEDFEGNWSLLYYDQQEIIEKPVKKTSTKKVVENFPGIEKQVAFTSFLTGRNQRYL